MNKPTLHLFDPKYRPDIDGLRAVAVLSVVVFHAFPSAMKGGFIGVDVFFVISGFLISKIIFEDLDGGTFSFVAFYTKRIKRIFPALLLVLMVSYVFGWFVLLAVEYKQLGKHIAAGAGFVSNLVLQSEAGYFDNSAETKPLLHLWSLGIEEQFYIAWPFVLWFAWKRRFNIIALSIVVAGLSFYFNLKGIKENAVATFYSPQTRFWELLSGGVLAWFVLYKKNIISNCKMMTVGYRVKHFCREYLNWNGKLLPNVSAFIGAAFLIYGFLRISKNVSFPGCWAVIPVLGAILIIVAGPQSWINRTILSSKVAVWFGLISFPLYLWHWILLSFARIFEGDVPSFIVRAALIMLSIFLAWLTYKLVEFPIRFVKDGGFVTTALIILMFIVANIGYFTYFYDGIKSRKIHQQYISYVDSIKISDRAKECFEIPYAYKKSGDWFCSLGEGDSPIEYFAHGDSHALSLLPALENFAFQNKLKIQFTGTSGCPSVLGVQSMRGNSTIEVHNCKELNERVFNYVKISGIKSVILASRWTYYTDSLSRPHEFNPIARNPSLTVDKSSSTNDLIWAMKNTVARYASIGVKVTFIEDNPQQKFDPKDVLRRGRGIDSEYLKLSVTVDEHRKNQHVVNDALRKSGAKVINLDDVLCPANVCGLVADSTFLYSDDDHLSVAGAIFISQALSARLRR